MIYDNKEQFESLGVRLGDFGSHLTQNSYVTVFTDMRKVYPQC